MRDDQATEMFLAHRNLLFTVAYEMLGSAADAEDVLQETWLRWVEVDTAQVRDERAYLVRITTRQSLNRLRSMKRRKESYVGPWLPDPLLTTPDVAEDAELAESLSMALMLVLETLAPTERAVFVLREVFGFGYAEIAAAVDKNTAAVRKIAERAHRHVAARRPRESVSARQSREVLESFQRAIETGEIQGLLDVLAPDVILVSDGGGVKHAALRPVLGARKVASMFRGGLGRLQATVTAELTVVNGNPALAVYLDGEFDGIMALRLQNEILQNESLQNEGRRTDGLDDRAEDGGADTVRIAGLYYVRNPAKLTRAESVTALTLH